MGNLHLISASNNGNKKWVYEGYYAPVEVCPSLNDKKLNGIPITVM